MAAFPAVTDEQIERVAGCLKAIASPLRLRIVCLLAEGERSVNEIVADTGGSQPNVSQHLTLLTDRGLLGFRKEANRVIYFLKSAELIRILEQLKAVYC